MEATGSHTLNLLRHSATQTFQSVIYLFIFLFVSVTQLFIYLFSYSSQLVFKHNKRRNKPVAHAKIGPVNEPLRSRGGASTTTQQQQQQQQQKRHGVSQLDRTLIGKQVFPSGLWDLRAPPKASLQHLATIQHARLKTHGQGPLEAQTRLHRGANSVAVPPRQTKKKGQWKLAAYVSRLVFYAVCGLAVPAWPMGGPFPSISH